MEKLICPECGNAVSPDATVCKNCGCKITVCPDCGAVYKDGQVRCTECGHVLSEETLAANIREDAKKIETRIDADAKREKIFSRTSKVIDVFGLLFFFAPFVLSFLWRDKDDLEFLAIAETVKRVCKSSVCIGIILSVLSDSILGFLKDLIGTLQLCSWIKEIKFDYREYIRTYGKNGGEAGLEKDYAEKLSEAALLLENKREKLVFDLMYVLRFLVGFVIIVTASVWVDDLFNKLVLLRYADITIEWANTEFYVAVIVLAVSIIIRIAYYFIYQKHIKEKKQEILNTAKK